MILLMCSRKSAFSSLARIDGFVVIPAGKPRSSASSISNRFAESTKIFMVFPSGLPFSLRHRPIVVAVVAGLPEEAAPSVGVRVCPRGELPALELLPLDLVHPAVPLYLPVHAPNPPPPP